ncbi:MAG: 6-phosphofructokinase [Acidimicrobiaceae bacterium]|nr:6-phosphofructokinase [Acidimicrobiaceae bacterium]MYC42227.1 6-phosphofructokinase [Acidimicrobiaceae bacterium]MYH88277.1 6-phosphofructokinase [Acidimicrobiaceae bacterium]
MKVGVLTGGGDCPGLNAVIRGVVRKAERTYGDEVVGFLDGWRGLLDDRQMPLDVEACRGLVTRGGTILGTSRDQPYMFDDGVERVKATMARHCVDALIVIGGEGTLSAAARVHADGVALVGVPKTIDNDVAGTDRTFGFDTAVQTATDAIDRLRTTAESHDRVIVVEVMGRHVGHIATWAGIAGGATIVLVPEEPFDISAICESLRRRHQRGRFSSIVVVAEGATPAPGTLDVSEPTIDEYGHARLGGIGSVVADEIEQRTGFETRVTVLGHVQRGGTPSALDRVLSTWYGVAAMTAAHEGDFGTMVAFQNNRVVRMRLDECVASLKYTHPDLLSVARTFFP